MNQCKRLSDCPAERLAQCRGEAVPAAKSGQWKMVPVIATEEMIRFANVAVPKTPNAQWNAMLSAAPVPPAGDVEVLPDRMVVPMARSFFGPVHISHDIAAGFNACLDAVAPLLARLTAERDGLLEKLADTEECYRSAAQRADLYGEELKSTSDELTKARELLDVSHSLITFYLEQLVDNDSEPEDILIADQTLAEIQVALGRQSTTPIAHNVDDSCGQDAEVAKGGDDVCQSCGSKGWTANCNHCIPY